MKFSFILLLLFSSNLLSQNIEKEIRLIENPFRGFDPKKSDSIFNAWDRDLERALEKKDTGTLGQLYLKMGVAFGFLADYDKSTKSLFYAEKIFAAVGDQRRRAYTLCCLALNANIDTDKRFQFLKEAYSIYESLQDTMRLGIILNAYGVVYAKEHQFDSAIVFFRKAKDFALKANSAPVLGVITGNIANWHTNCDNYEKAMSLSKKAIQLLPNKYFINTVVIKYAMFAAFTRRNMPDSIFYYYEKYRKDLSLRPHLLAKAYKIISTTYSMTGNNTKALAYYKKADSLNTLLYKQRSKSLLQIVDLEYKSELKQKAIKELYEKNKRDRMIYLSLIIISLITISLGIILYYFQKERARRNHEAKVRAETEQRLIQSELKNSELQRMTLNNELKFTNKELSSYAANIVKDTDHLNDIKSHINTALNEDNLKKAKEQLRELNVRINQLYHKDEDRKEFIERTHRINHSLIFFLKSNYPQLNDNDLNLMVLLMLKFSSKEIATLSNLEAGSVKTKRYRLRKKLGLKDRENFDNFIDEVVKDFKAVYH